MADPGCSWNSDGKCWSRHKTATNTSKLTQVMMALCTDSKVESMMNKAGYVNPSKIATTLQGSIWRAQQLQNATNDNIVAKITNIYLHSQSVMIINDKQYKVDENILSEIAILKYLTKDKKCPNSIIKYVNAFQR